jgi:hypothetical protein
MNLAQMGDLRNVCKTRVRKHEGKRTLGRPEHRWQDNTKINLKEVRCWA